MCVRERERDRDRDRQTVRQIESEVDNLKHILPDDIIDDIDIGVGARAVRADEAHNTRCILD